MNLRRIAVILLLVGLLVIAVAASPASGVRNITVRLPKHPTRVYDVRRLDQIQMAVVHHTAGPVTQTPEDIARYHVGPNHICDAGCPGIAYHYMIDRTATTFQVNELETISYHVSGQNTISVGICLIGNYDDIEPTKEQLNAVIRLIRMLNRKLGRALEIAGHRDFANKSCPGEHVDVDWIRQKVYGYA